MAGNDEFNLEDFELGDIDDLMADPLDNPDIDGDRKPIDNYKAGALNSITSADTQSKLAKTLIRNALPTEYGDAIRAAGDVGNQLGDLKDELAKSTELGMDTLKDLAKDNEAKIAQYVPAFIAEKLKAFGESKEEKLYSAQVDYKQLETESTLNDIFGRQEENMARIEAAKAETASALGTAQVSAMNLNTNESVMSNRLLQRLVGYQDDVLTAYYKKSLETQLRTLFTGQELVSITKAFSKDTTSLLTAVVKNSSLPDWQKTHLSETYGEIATKNLLSSGTDFVSDKLSGFTDGVKAKATDLIKDFGANFNDAIGSLQELMDAGDQIDDPDMADQLLSEMTTEELTNYAMTRLGKVLKPMLAKSGLVAEGAEDLGYLMQNAPALLTEQVNGMSGLTGDALRALMPDLGSNNLGVDLGASAAGLRGDIEPFPYNIDANTSLIEIIPGLLSRQLEQLEIFNGGKGGRIAYDNQTREFVSSGELGNRVGKRMDKSLGKESRQQSISQYIDRLDSEKSLSATQRKLLAKELLQQTNNGDTRVDFNQLAGRSESPAIQALYAKAANLPELERKELRGRLSTNLRSVTEGYSDGQKYINKMVGSGQIDALRQAGLVTTNDDTLQVDNNAMRTRLANGQFTPSDRVEQSKYQDVETEGKFGSYSGAKHAAQESKNQLRDSLSARQQQLRGMGNTVLGGLTNSAGLETLNGAKDAAMAKMGNWNAVGSLGLVDGLTNAAMASGSLLHTSAKALKDKTNMPSVETSWSRHTLSRENRLLPDSDENSMLKNYDYSAPNKTDSLSSPSMMNSLSSLSASDGIVGGDPIGNPYVLPDMDSMIASGMNPNVNSGSPSLSDKLKSLSDNISSSLSDRMGSISYEGVGKSVDGMTRNLLDSGGEISGELLGKMKDLLGSDNLLNIGRIPPVNLGDSDTYNEANNTAKSPVKTTVLSELSALHNTVKSLKDNLFSRGVSGAPVATDNASVEAVSALEEQKSFRPKGPRPGNFLSEYMRDTDGVQSLPVTLTDEDKEASDLTDLLDLVGGGFKLNHELLAAIGHNTTGPNDGEGSGVFDTAGRFGKNILSGAGSFAKSYYDGVSGFMKTGSNIIGGGVGGVMSFTKDLLTGGSGNTDVYVKGDPEPVMTARKMRSGEYTDKASGKTIYKLKDIKGEVLDSDGNVILTEEDFDAGVYDNSGGRLDKLMSLAFSPLKGIASAQMAAIKLVTELPMKLLKGGYKGIGALNKRISDVYVKGQTSPKLLASIFKMNGYVSVGSGKVLSSPSDIDGPVADLTGNIVLSQEDIQNGLVDARGGDITSGNIMSLVKGAMNIAKKAGKAIIDVNKRSLQMVGNVASSGANLVMGLTGLDRFTSNGQALAGSENSEVLDKMYAFMEKTWGTPDKVIPGDADGDGDRDGGWRDILARRKEKEADAEAEAQADQPEQKEKEEKEGLLSKLSSFFPSLLTAVTGLGTTILGGLSSLMGLVTGGNALDSLTDAGLPDGNNRRPGKKGFFGKMGGLLKSGAGKAMGVMSSAAAMLPGAGAMLSTAGAFAARSAATAAAVAGGLITAPVGLVIGAGAVAYGLYAYFGKRVDPEPLEKLRYLQYGLSEDSSSTMAAIRDFEGDMIDYVEAVKGKSPNISIGIVEATEEYAEEHFNIDLQDKEATRQWQIWFAQRFLPVFTTHLAAAHNIDPDIDILDVDDEMEDEHKTRFINAVTPEVWPDTSPYEIYAMTIAETTIVSNVAEIEAHKNKLLAKHASAPEKATPAPKDSNGAKIPGMPTPKQNVAKNAIPAAAKRTAKELKHRGSFGFRLTKLKVPDDITVTEITADGFKGVYPDGQAVEAYGVGKIDSIKPGTVIHKGTEMSNDRDGVKLRDIGDTPDYARNTKPEVVDSNVKLPNVPKPSTVTESTELVKKPKVPAPSTVTEVTEQVKKPTLTYVEPEQPDEDLDDFSDFLGTDTKQPVSLLTKKERAKRKSYAFRTPSLNLPDAITVTEITKDGFKGTYPDGEVVEAFGVGKNSLVKPGVTLRKGMTFSNGTDGVALREVKQEQTTRAKRPARRVARPAPTQTFSNMVREQTDIYGPSKNSALPQLSEAVYGKAPSNSVTPVEVPAAVTRLVPKQEPAPKPIAPEDTASPKRSRKSLANVTETAPLVTLDVAAKDNAPSLPGETSGNKVADTAIADDAKRKHEDQVKREEEATNKITGTMVAVSTKTERQQKKMLGKFDLMIGKLDTISKKNTTVNVAAPVVNVETAPQPVARPKSIKVVKPFDMMAKTY